MKIKPYQALITVILLLCCCFQSLCESSDGMNLIPGEDWAWSRGAYNTFSGTICLEEGIVQDLNICIRIDLPYDGEKDQQSTPVFTSVNGKRIVMAKQSDTVHMAADAEQKEISFSVSFRLPEKQRVTSVPVTICIMDTENNEIKTISGRIDSGQDETLNNGNTFFISVNIQQITVVLAVMAGMIWLIVLVRTIIWKKRKTGES